MVRDFEVCMNETGNRAGSSNAPAANGGAIHRMKCGEYGGRFWR